MYKRKATQIQLQVSTVSVHSAAQNSSDNFFSYTSDSYCGWDILYKRGGLIEYEVMQKRCWKLKYPQN